MPLIPIPDPVKSLLAHQKQLVRQWAASANVTPVDEARYFRQDWPPLNSLEWRLTVATNSGLFIEGHNRHPARAGILKMQGRIAHSVHCLSYARNHAGRRAPGRWVTDGDPIVKNGRRAPSYLDHYVDGYEPEPMSIPKVDVAMIAHCFRTPVEVWELHDDDQFAYWLQQATADYDLFSFGGLAIPDNSLRVTDLGPAPTTPVAKAGGGVQEVEHPPVPAWRFLRFSVTLPQAFQTAQVMLFEDDGTAVTLVSSNAQTDYNLVYTNGLFQTPRIRADPPPLPSMWFNPCLRSEFITLIVADDAPLRLDQLAFFRNGDVRTVQTLDCEQIADLRRRLFALPRDKWCMLKKVVSVVPPHAP